MRWALGSSLHLLTEAIMNQFLAFCHGQSAVQWPLVGFLSLALCATQSSAVQAAGEPPEIRAAIESGKGYLRTTGATLQSGGLLSLSALALAKDGEPVNSPVVARALQSIQGKIGTSGYKAVNPSQQIYEAGVDLMLLANTDPERYKPQMQAITDFLVQAQYPGGEWDYPTHDGGDTSMVQYAMLGLWAADRNGIKVSPRVVEGGARWLLKTQLPSGGFDYHPMSRTGENKGETLSMTAAGLSGLLIARLLLYPESDPFSSASRKEQSQEKKKFGVLETVDIDATPEERAAAGSAVDERPTLSVNAFNTGIGRAYNALSARFTVRITNWNMYFLYTVERLAALGNYQQIGGRNWYNDGTRHLLETQNEENGSWRETGPTSPAAGTAFGVLFLTRATAKTLGRPEVGGGLLAGGRGLPDDLSQARFREGKVEEEKKLGPLDELLKELANTQNFNVEVQQAIVEKVQIATPEDREKLIQQKDLLLRLTDDKRDEVRRTAMWALGRTDDLRVVPALLDVLRRDNNVDVLIEARYSLCSLSRKPNGFGLDPNPWDDLPPNASDQQKQQALEEWRQNVVQRWSEWYEAVRPYDERELLLPPER